MDVSKTAVRVWIGTSIFALLIFSFLRFSGLPDVQLLEPMAVTFGLAFFALVLWGLASMHEAKEERAFAEIVAYGCFIVVGVFGAIRFYQVFQALRVDVVLYGGSAMSRVNYVVKAMTIPYESNLTEHFYVSYVLMGIGLIIGLLFYKPLCQAPLKKLMIYQGSETKDGPWQASWLNKDKVTELIQNKTGIPLGRVDGKILRYKSDPDRGWLGGHIAAISGTRGGKGVSLIAPAVLEHDGPVVVLDIKGEIFATTRRHRESLGRKIVNLNPFGIIEKSADQYNPFSYIRKEAAARDISAIADGLVRKQGGSNSHFSEIARSLVEAAIWCVWLDELNEGIYATLDGVRECLLDGKLEDFVELAASKAKESGTNFAKPLKAIRQIGDRELGSYMSTIMKNIKWVSDRPMMEVTEESTFELDDLLEDKLDLYITIPLDQIDAQSNYLRMMVNIIFGTAIRQMGNGNVAKPILFVLDEFTRLGRLDTLTNIVTVGAGAGFIAMFVAQDVASIEEAMGKPFTKTLFGGCAVLMVWAPGRSDIDTAKLVSDAVGDRTIITRSAEEKLLDQTNRTSQQRVKIITADQVLELSPNKIVALIRSHPPLMLDRIISYTEEPYKSQLDPNPTL